MTKEESVSTVIEPTQEELKAIGEAIGKEWCNLFRENVEFRTQFLKDLSKNFRDYLMKEEDGDETV